jgi:hypothetical protein
LIALGQRQRDDDPERTCSHRREIAERRDGRSVADLEVVEPLSLEVDPFDGSIGRYDHALTGRHLEHGGIVPNSFR